jgi:hypothetical protein
MKWSPIDMNSHHQFTGKEKSIMFIILWCCNTFVISTGYVPYLPHGFKILDIRKTNVFLYLEKVCVGIMYQHYCRSLQFWSERIERFIEDQACSPNPSIAPSPVSKLHTWKTEKERQLADGRRGGRAKSYDGEQAWSSLNNSILYELFLFPTPASVRSIRITSNHFFYPSPLEDWRWVLSCL